MPSTFAGFFIRLLFNPENGASLSSQMSLDFYSTTQRCNPEDRNHLSFFSAQKPDRTASVPRVSSFTSILFIYLVVLNFHVGFFRRKLT
jgi:hypothetical protein